MRRLTTLVAPCAIVALFGLGTVACHRSEAPDAKQRVERALKDANLDKNVNVDWDKDANVVHLKGTVDTPELRQRADQVASGAVGTTGKVLDELKVQGMDEKTADDRDKEIKDSIKERIDRDQVLRDRDVKVDVNNGVVTLSGEVRTPAEKSQVTEITRGIPGVKQMANELKVKPKR